MSRPWRIHELTRDIDLEDVWALPTPGGADDFPKLVEVVANFDPSGRGSPAVRALFAIRQKVGELLRWDEPHAPGEATPTLRDRLPADLRDGPAGPESSSLGFTTVYMTRDEWVVEIFNRTVHGLIHLGWVPDETGGYRGEMAIYVKRNGLLGAAYMLAIAPFRHLVVYPRLMRELERDWRSRADG